MKKIIVTYWKEHDLIPYFRDNSVFDYSVETQSEIIQMILERGLSVMVKPNMGFKDDILLIYINRGSFTADL